MLKGDGNMRPILIVAMVIILAGLTVEPAPALQCPDRDKLSADQKLQFLETGIDRTDRAAVACAVLYMDDLGSAQDPGALQVMIRYLDLKLTPAELQLQIASGPQLYGGEYPAMDDLSWYPKKQIVPVLVATIAQTIPDTTLSRNSIRLLMAIEAPDPPAGVRLLVQESWKERGNSAAFLMEAAKYAATTYQCRHLAEACHAALYTGP